MTAYAELLTAITFRQCMSSLISIPSTLELYPMNQSARDGVTPDYYRQLYRLISGPVCKAHLFVNEFNGIHDDWGDGFVFGLHELNCLQ